MSAALRASVGGEIPSPISGWLNSELEFLNQCPLCACTTREDVHVRQRDLTFGSEGEGWSVRRCAACELLYVDPRPRPSCLHRLYASYYTHGETVPMRRARSSGWRQRAIAAYVRDRYGCREGAAWPLGSWIMRLVPPARRRYDRDFRYLPLAPREGQLLDVGCGNGDFLAIAQSCGWNTLGIDPDPKAVEQARSRGLTARQGQIDSLELQEHSFDVITLSHVLEHVLDPRDLIQRCLRLLKPGGKLWLETPNADAIGHQVFGAAWRGLECPRHVVLFNPDNLLRLLRDCGFERVRLLPRHSALRPLFKDSLALAEGRPPESRRRLTGPEHLRLLGLQLWAALSPHRAEVMAIEAYRPEDSV